MQHYSGSIPITSHSCLSVFIFFFPMLGIQAEQHAQVKIICVLCDDVVGGPNYTGGRHCTTGKHNTNKEGTSRTDDELGVQT